MLQANDRCRRLLQSAFVKDPLLGPLAAIASGILVARFVPFQQSELFLVIGAFLLLGVIAILRRARILAGTCCCLGLFFTGALTSVTHQPGPAPELDAEGREIVILAGCVVEPPAVSGERERFVLELELHARAQVTLYTKSNEALPALRYGQNIELDARVRKPHNYGNPGAFDYAHYLARRDIYWTASSAAASLRILPGHCGSSWAKFTMDLRANALDRIARIYQGRDYQTAMVQAILLGQNYQLQRLWTEDYRNTGTFHTLVVSGTHVAILAAFFLFLLRLCFVPEHAAWFLTAGAAWFYAVIAGWGAPCVRSAAGLTLFAIARYFYRERRPLNLLAAVALGFLLLDPDQLFDAGFQLTFMAVAFLGAFASPLLHATTGPLMHGLSELGDIGRDMHLAPRAAQFRIEMRLLISTLRLALKMPARLASMIVVTPARAILFFLEVCAVSAVSQVGLALPMVVYFHRVGLSGLSANAFIVPLLGIAVPIGFIAMLTGWAWIANLAGWLLGISRTVVGWHAAIEPHWRIPPPPLWLGIALASALIVFAICRERPGWRIATGAVLGFFLTLLLWHPFPSDTRPGELEMTAIDVGQGDSILVVFPDGKRMLVDGGGIPSLGAQSRTQLDIGEEVVAPYLWERSIRSLDVVALTHAHEDHIGGLPAIEDDFHPRELWTGVTPESPTWKKLRGEAAKLGTRIVPLYGPRKFQFGGAEIDVLAPLADYIPHDIPSNDDSLVMRIRYGARSFLLCGDVEKPIERRMLADNEIERTDVLKVGHHGSRTSSTQGFLDAAAPAFAVISVGQDNSYGHPNRDVLERLAEHHAAVYRTDQDGLVTVRTDGKRLWVETGRSLSTGLLSPIFP